MLRMSFAAAFTLWIPTVVMAGHEPLTIGDTAPALDVAHWLKGNAIEEFEPGRIYVMEFWATWCAPCRASIPHISELATQYKDYGVSFLGVSDEKLQTVVKFLLKADRFDTTWDDKIQYTLATDPDRSTKLAYMRGAAQEGIPTAFIIGKDRRIEWIGGPMEIDEVLSAVVGDRWDRDVFKVQFEENVAPVRQAMAVMDAIDTAAEDQNWKAAQVALDDLILSQPGYDRLKATLFRKMIHKANDPAEAYEYGRKLLAVFWDTSGMLNMMAWVTVDDDGVKSRDLAFALKAAKRANTLTDESDPAILDTLARVYFEQGDVRKAIVWQALAAKKAAGTPYAESIQETLDKYRRLAESQL